MRIIDIPSSEIEKTLTVVDTYYTINGKAIEHKYEVPADSPRGRQILANKMKNAWFVCSYCGHKSPVKEHSDVCPRCCALMDVVPM